MLDQPMKPVQSGDRIHLIDVLRGFALLGILLVNMHFFIHPFFTGLFTPETLPPVLDQAAAWIVRFAAEGKFYSLFSFLFGLGLTIQMGRAEARQVRFVPLYLRRLLILLGIGAVHAFLIWTGDILIVYALLGVLLLLFRKAKPRTLLIWTAVILSLFILFNLAVTILITAGRAVPESAAQIEQAFAQQEAAFRAEAARAYDAYTYGTFVEATRYRVYSYFSFVVYSGPFMAPGVLAMFLIGVYFGRRRLFQEVEQQLPFFRKLLWWGLAVGVPCNLIFATLMGPTAGRSEPSLNLFVALTAQIVGAPALMLAYVAGFTLLFRREVWRQRLQPLAPVGQMALTNYLGQSLIAGFIFYGYGLGLYGQVGTAVGLLLALFIYALQVVLSNWWIRRFRFGPAEWLWRSLTYLKRQPMRREEVLARYA